MGRKCSIPQYEGGNFGCTRYTPRRSDLPWSLMGFLPSGTTPATLGRHSHPREMTEGPRGNTPGAGAADHELGVALILLRYTISCKPSPHAPSPRRRNADKS